MASSRLAKAERGFVQRVVTRERDAMLTIAQNYRTMAASLKPLWEEAYRRLQWAKRQGFDADYLSGFFWSERRQALLFADAVRYAELAGQAVGVELSSAMQTSSMLAQQSVQREIVLELAATGKPGAVTAATMPVNFPATEALVLSSRMGNGSPIVETMARRFGQRAPEIMKSQLLIGMANGESPTVVSRRIRRAFGADYGSTTVLVRSEMFRVYRDVTLATYQANTRYVKGWQWVSALSESTCPMCWAMHGQEFPLTERMATHPACRCSQVPVLKSWAEINPGLAKLDTQLATQSREIPLGVDVFDRLPAEKKAAIMGPKLYRAFRNGQVQLADIPAETWSRDWGAGRRQRSVVEMIGR